MSAPVNVLIEKRMDGAIERYVKAMTLVGGPLVRSYHSFHDGLTARTISVLVVGWMRDAGIKHYRRDGVSAHALRHTAASDVLQRCSDVRIVQSMLGHCDLNTTAIYLRWADLAQLREAMEGRTYGVAA